MRCSVGQQWRGTTCQGCTKVFSLQEANDYTDELCKAGGYAGLNNWRVPNLNGLVTISKLQCGPPRINGKVFPGAEAEVYWSKTSTPSDKGYAYTFCFGIAEWTPG